MPTPTRPLKLFCPEKVLLLVRSVVEETMSDPPTLKVAPLMVPSVPVMRLVPIEEVATSLPLWSVPRSELVIEVRYVLPDTVSAVDDAKVAFQLVDQPVVIVPRVEVEFPKMLRPVQVLLLVRSVVDATVMEPPSDTEDPLMVSDEFWSWLLPIVDVETKRVPSKARSVPWVYEVALDPPFAIESAEPRVRVPIVAVFELRNVVVAPALKSARPPCVDTPVVLSAAV